MRILFTVGIGILPEQRIKRWQMVSDLYSKLARSFISLGHQVYFYVHPEAYTESIPPHLCWQSEDHSHLDIVMENFTPDFVFCWNGSSNGDIATATIAQAYGAKSVFSEQGWFPQKDTLYFDFSGCNGKCSTRYRPIKLLNDNQEKAFLKRRKEFIQSIRQEEAFDTERFSLLAVDTDKPIFVPLQDERDLNIVQDSPFKTMDELVGFLTSSFPDNHFIVRPHPKYPNPRLSDYRNITIGNPKTPMFKSLSQCGLVIGINSTTLLESALLGFPVVSLGESLATGTGLFYDMRPSDVIDDLSNIRIDRLLVMSELYHLLCVKQILRMQLDNPIAILNSGFFREMKENLNWTNIYR